MKPVCITAIFLLTCFSSVYAQSSNSDFPRFRISLQGGWSYRLAKISDNAPAELREYNKGLKPGFHLGVDGGYFFTKNIGCGLKYAYFKAGNEIANVSIPEWSGGANISLIKDDIHVHYIAPSFYSRFPIANDKLVFLAGASIGYLRYIDNAVVVSDRTLTGGTVGLGFDLGMDYMITPHFAVGANLGLIGGSLSKLKYKDSTIETDVKLEDGQRENLTRLDLSAGVRWYFQ